MSPGFFTGFSLLIGYFILFALGALMIRRYAAIGEEPFRKLLHFILLLSLPVFLYAFTTWQQSALAALSFAALAYPMLALGEHMEAYARLLAQRRRGEIKRSLMIAFGMFALLICLCWGWLDDRMLALSAIYAWGFGDAAAALVGRRFGRHPLRGKLIEGCKSVEGTLAMFATSAALVFAVLLLRGGIPWHLIALTAASTGAVLAAVELYTLRGYDTITCPLAAAAVIIPLTMYFERLPL